MAKKSIKKAVQEFFFNPVFYVILLGIVIVFAMVILSISKQKAEQATVPQETVSGNTSAQQTISIKVNDPNHLTSVNNQGSQQTAAILNNLGTGDQSGTKKVVYSNGDGQIVRGRALFKIDHFKKLALQPLQFDLFNDKGNLITPEFLKTDNEQKLHFYVVSANLREFQHLNPVYENGKWNVNANLPNKGSYYAYAWAKTIKDQYVLSINELVVQEQSGQNLNYPGLTPNLLAVSNGVQAKAAISPLKGGGLNFLNFTVTRDNKPLALQPLRETFGNLVLIKQGAPNVFIMGEQQPGADDAGGQTGFSANILSPGKYTAFAEFRVEDKFLQFPITFEIKP